MVDNANKCAIAILQARTSLEWPQRLCFGCSATTVNALPLMTELISNSIDAQLQGRRMFPLFYRPIWDRAIKWIQASYMDLRILYVPILFYDQEYCKPTENGGKKTLLNIFSNVNIKQNLYILFRCIGPWTDHVDNDSISRKLVSCLLTSKVNCWDSNRGSVTVL